MNNNKQHIRERLFQEEDQTLSKALAICEAAELSLQHIQEMEQNNPTEVCYFNKNKNRKTN